MADVLSTELDLRIDPQPDEETCGPTSLHAIYRFHGDDIAADEVIRGVEFLPSGGTLAVYLALHAMRRGYKATIYTANVVMFDPTWFEPAPPHSGGELDDAPPRPAVDLIDKLRQQYKAKGGAKLKRATDAYIEYLGMGGRLLMEDITLDLLASHIRRGRPIIAGLSATWLYRSIREREGDWADDDVAGLPLGHFVVLHGVDTATRRVSVADPYDQVPYPGSHHYSVHADRVIGAIMLGIVTYDGKLLILEPPTGR